MSPSRIVITGASRGIGAALARLYAGPGVSLALLGRDTGQLDAVAAACRTQGAEAETVVADVRDRSAMAERLLAIDAARPVDLVVANAGVAMPPGGPPAEDSTAYGEIDTNLLGALNSVLPLLPGMAARRSGQVAFVSSLAAFAPLPNAAGYSATKAAILAYGLAARHRLRASGIRVSVVCPGYVDTEMGDRYGGWQPLKMSADAAALRIRAGLAANRAVVAFPRRLALVARLSPFTPEPILRLSLKAFQFPVVKAT